MTIDEHIGVIEDLKSAMSVCMPEPEKTEICTSLGEAIDTMRKYQKLERLLDKIRAEIINYEGDCRLSVDEYPSCKQCTDNVFESIYAIIDKCKSESEK